MSHPYGYLSLLPPLIAILLAILTRKAVWSLFAGLAVGALLMRQGDVPAAIYDLFEVHLWPTLIDPGKLRVFSFTLLMGGLVGLIIRCGGMKGFVEWISPLARSRRGGQLTTWMMGWIVFFDDYASSILLGNTLRPVCDRLKISREKLAYVVDSTAAPIAGLSLLSTWVAVEIDYIREGLTAMGNPTGFHAVEMFVASIPYRFYVLGSLAMVALVALFGRDYGPMLAAERRRLAQADVIERSDCDGGDGGDGDTVASLTESVEHDNNVGPIRPSHWINAIGPIVITVLVVIALIYATGRSALAAGASETGAYTLRDIVGAADSSIALQYGSLVGLVVAAILCRVQGLLDMRQIMRAIQQGAAVVIPAIAILWFASALSRMTSDRDLDGLGSIDSGGAQTFAHRDHRLYTGVYLASVVVGEDRQGEATTTLKLLPTISFVLAGVVAFCTGTSFGTMGMLIPMVLTLCYNLLESGGGTVSPHHPLLLATLGGVLAGAVFGDHCSPISDTTILSSQACGCDHMAHVITQFPYALTIALVAIVLGTLPIGWGVSPMVVLPLQWLALIGVLFVFGEKVDDGR